MPPILLAPEGARPPLPPLAPHPLHTIHTTPPITHTACTQPARARPPDPARTPPARRLLTASLPAQGCDALTIRRLRLLMLCCVCERCVQGGREGWWDGCHTRAAHPPHARFPPARAPATPPPLTKCPSSCSGELKSTILPTPTKLVLPTIVESLAAPTVPTEVVSKAYDA